MKLDEIDSRSNFNVSGEVDKSSNATFPSTAWWVEPLTTLEDLYIDIRDKWDVNDKEGKAKTEKDGKTFWSVSR